LNWNTGIKFGKIDLQRQKETKAEQIFPTLCIYYGRVTRRRKSNTSLQRCPKTCNSVKKDMFDDYLQRTVEKAKQFLQFEDTKTITRKPLENNR